jgi:hypothetical protein
MNQVLEIPDEAFANNRGILPPPDKRRSSILAFISNLETANDNLNRQKRDLLDRVEANNTANVLMQLLQNISSFQQEVRTFMNEQKAFNEEITRIHDFATAVSENRIARDMGTEGVNVPFLRTSVIPANTALPYLRSAEEIEQLTLSRVRIYLQAYEIDFDPTSSRRMLKDLLRIKIGFTSIHDLAVKMS